MRRESWSLTNLFRTVSISNPIFEHENLRAVTVKSAALGRRGDVSVWAPPSPVISTLLILLHGVYGSHWSWSLEGGVHSTAQRLLSEGRIAPLVIAMPSDGLFGDGSGYLHWPDCEDVERWIIEEVPAIARIAAPSLRADARLALAGLSMGGYGAMRLGGKFPDLFTAISAHSAITDIGEIASFVEEPLQHYLDTAPRPELSVLYWWQRNRDRRPRLRFDCGTDDELIANNRNLHHALDVASITHTYEEFPGGHEWSYWQKHVERTLEFVAPPSDPAQ
jgi:putative tributyrin esterase